ncbi:NAD-dependent epimerase/dehydratase family protein [Geothrix oryzisoli]|uniref:NAD-dependent epimerase/dehydratase family protein n=1 Tax=Geothrix oryzisoli TaxID=2922721 RepID=UPI003084152A
MTGEGSYVGRSFMRHVGGACRVDEVSVRDEAWRTHDFSPYDAVLHVAAIVHQPRIQDRDLYFQVNRDLPREICRKAVQEGVRQFVFMSTMAVYGRSPSYEGAGEITPATECRPGTPYGESKHAAEGDLLELRARHPFRLGIVRAPMVYGAECPGNYFRRLMWMGRRLPVFPSLRDNRLSMIGIRNLCELLRLIIQQEAEGVHCPDDLDAYGTQDRLGAIARAFDRDIRMARIPAPFSGWLALERLGSLYGDLYYGGGFDHFNGRYVVDSFQTTVAALATGLRLQAR